MDYSDLIDEYCKQMALAQLNSYRLELSMQALSSNNPLEAMMCAQALEILDDTEKSLQENAA